MQAAIDWGPHVSALVQDAMDQFDEEIAEKVLNGQASGHNIVHSHKIVRLRILTSILLATSMFVLNA